jgi:phage anti-repressor protein
MQLDITTYKFSTEEVNGVSARDLYRELELDSSNFSRWCKSNIVSNGYVIENQDWVRLVVNDETPTGGKVERTDYIISTDMAKRLAMKSESSKAEEVRTYFIECEKTLKSLSNIEPQLALPSPRSQAINVIKECLELTALFNIPEHISQLEAVKQAQDETGFDATPMLRLAPAQQSITKEAIMLEPTQLSKHFGLSAKTMNLYLEELGLQHKVLDNWHPIGEGESMAAINHWKSNYGSKDGYNYRWNLTMLKEFIANR